MRSLGARILTALIGIPIFLAMIHTGGLYLQILIVCMVVLALREFASFVSTPVYWDYLLLAGLSFLVVTYVGLNGYLLTWLALQLLYYLVRTTVDRRQPLADSWHMLAVLYAAPLFGFLWLVRDQFGFRWAFFALMVTWLTDSGAYFSGAWLGKHPLAPKISPNKTIEGGLGGLSAAVLGGIVFAIILDYPIVPLALLTLTLSAIGQFGDLVESAIKREQAVKDSGHLLPGHGGILDRFDSLFFVLPVLYLLLSLVQ